jgi:hypothetical protein
MDMTEKYDFMIEAIRMSHSGQLEAARLYQRRGASYSDRIILTRPQLLEQLAAGKRIAAGSRQHRLASTFTVSAEIIRYGKEKPVLCLAEETASADHLPGIPFF